jgi:DNA-binding HxlR family transcriptional regulator
MSQNPQSKRPVMSLIDIIGRRWTLRIIWELREGGLTSRALRSACDDASPTVIHQRLKELRAALLVEKSPDHGFILSPSGRELLTLLLPLSDFAKQWASDLPKDFQTSSIKPKIR